jgi:hypothetical protein
MSFFEKRRRPPCGNQETFLHLEARHRNARIKEKKFFASFFQKRSLTFFLIALATSPTSHRIARACAEDAARYCANDQGHIQRACLAQHHVSLRLVCRQALAAAEPSR